MVKPGNLVLAPVVYVSAVTGVVPHMYKGTFPWFTYPLAVIIELLTDDG